MQIITICFAILLGLMAPVVVWAQPMSTPIVDPPRQQMQSVIANLLDGPFLLNVTGKTFAGDAFLDVAVTDNGTPVADGTTVTLSAVPTTSGDSQPDAASPLDLTATTNAGHAKFVPTITAPGDWTVTLGVTGVAGAATAPPQKIGFDPLRPADTPAYALSSLALPILSVILLVAFFRWRHIELEQWPSGREPAQQNRPQQTRPAVA
jgi:hypothetical protein